MKLTPAAIATQSWGLSPSYKISSVYFPIEFTDLELFRFHRSAIYEDRL